jgi:NTE family protein
LITRHKDVQFAGRSQNQIMRQKQLHKLRPVTVIAGLVDHVPGAERRNFAVRALAAYGCVTQMHAVSLQVRMSDMEDHMKDIDHHQSRWQADYQHTRRAIEQAPWEAPVDPHEGVVLRQGPARD